MLRPSSPKGATVTDTIARGLSCLLESNASLDPKRRQQLSKLYRSHWQGLCQYVRHHFGAGPPEPEDVAQSAFARLARTEAAQVENPPAFLYATARDLVVDHHRRERRAEAFERSSAQESKIFCTNCVPRTSYSRWSVGEGHSSDIRCVPRIRCAPGQ